jgi:ABC-type polysaccharide/polyol phosphate transport system ATPase subunit
MPSTSTSDVLLNLDRVNLVFKADVYRARTWRDVFTSLASNPVDFLVSSPDRIHIAKNVSFKISKGERVGIIGVNGAGKTSLCRCISGMYSPTSGKLETFGKVRAIFEPGIGIVPELTGRENAELLAKLMFPGDPEQVSMVNEALEFSELGQFLDVAYKYYSKGMQARLCLSLISAKACDVLILDEVFDGADLFFKEKLSKRVLKMIEESGAVLFVSHSPEQVHEICNRVIWLHHGQVMFDGDVQEGIERYRALMPVKEMRVGV